MSVSEAMAWASENGVKLSISEIIQANDSRYDADYEGLVYEQSVRYGALISEYSSGTITVMGSSEIDESKVVPDFVGSSYSKAKKWANTYGKQIKIEFSTSVSGEVGTVVEQTPTAYTNIEDCDTLYITVKAGQYKIKFSNDKGTTVPKEVTVTTGDDEIDFTTSDYTYSEYKDESTGKVYSFKGWYTQANGQGTKVEGSYDVSSNCTLYAYWKEKETFTYKFVNDDGTEISSGTVYEGETPTAPANPSKENYEFTGWSPSVGPVSSNVEYKATYTEAEETVDYDGDLSACTVEETVTTNDPSQNDVRFSGRAVKGKVSGEVKFCTCKKYKYEESSGGETGGDSDGPDEDPAGDSTGSEELQQGSSGSGSTDGTGEAVE